MKNFNQLRKRVRVEDATVTTAANATGSPTSSVMAMPPAVNGTIIRRKYKEFDVPTEVFSKFQKGRMKFERWSKFLNLEDENQRAIYEYAYRCRDNTIVLRDSVTGAMRAIRRRSANGL